MLFKDLIFPFGLHSKKLNIGSSAPPFASVHSKYLSVLKSLIPACLCGPQRSKKAAGKKKIAELERDLTPDR